MARLLMVTLLLLALAAASGAGARGATDPARRVPMVRTALERGELADALLDGHLAELGAAPGASRLGMAWAQVALENGHGRYSYNHNLGNIGPSDPEQPWYVSRLDGNFYRSFDSFAEGAQAYWRTVARCPGALRRFDVGLAAEGAKLLRACGYFGADLKAYSSVMTSLYPLGRSLAQASLARRAAAQTTPAP